MTESSEERQKRIFAIEDAAANAFGHASRGKAGEVTAELYDHARHLEFRVTPMQGNPGYLSARSEDHITLEDAETLGARFGEQWANGSLNLTFRDDGPVTSEDEKQYRQELRDKLNRAKAPING